MSDHEEKNVNQPDSEEFDFSSMSIDELIASTKEEIARIDEAEKWMKDTFGEKIVIFRAGARVLNVHAAGVSKIRAARDLQERLSRKILVCVGDAENDLTMLRGADYAFCPSDGSVAHLFDNVCPCGEGAVAEVILERIPALLKNKT